VLSVFKNNGLLVNFHFAGGPAKVNDGRFVQGTDHVLVYFVVTCTFWGVQCLYFFTVICLYHFYIRLDVLVQVFYALQTDATNLRHLN
jgi:hypothetical protein